MEVCNEHQENTRGSRYPRRWRGCHCGHRSPAWRELRGCQRAHSRHPQSYLHALGSRHPGIDLVEERITTQQWLREVTWTFLNK